MHAATIVHVCQSNCVEMWHEYIGFGDSYEGYYFICFRVSASSACSAWWSKKFSESIAEGGCETESNHLRFLVDKTE